MSIPLPFGEPDLPRAVRVVPAPVATTFRTIAAVREWPAWVPHLLDPVITREDGYLFRIGDAGSSRNVTLRPVLQTPVHLLAFETADRHQVWFRLRPAEGGGTETELVVRPGPARTRLERLRQRRQASRRAAWAAEALEALAGLFGAGTPASS